MKQFSAMFAVFALLISMVLPGSTAARPATDDGDFGTTTSSKVKTTGLYIVELADPPIVSYHGGITSLSATSPAALGTQKVNNTSSATQSYRTYLSTKRATALRGISTIVGGAPDVTLTYDTAFNGFAVKLTQAQAQAVAKLSGVRRVTPEEIRSIQTDTGPSFIGAMQKGDVTKPALFKASISPANEVPPVAGSNASGKGVFTYDDATNKLSFEITIKNTTGPITLAHVHRGAAGVAGPIANDIMPTMISEGVYVGSVTLTAPDETLLYASGLYVNFHTAANPTGELRGQVAPDKGEGMLVGSLDTGINYSHDSFASPGPVDGYVYTNPLGAGKYVGVCDPANASYQASFKCNAKLIGAWTFAATSNSPSPLGAPSPADDDGHGSHTGSTMAGNVVNPIINGLATGTASGVAPHANIIAYDVCGGFINGTYSAGCFTSAIVGAIDQATKDGVDVINYSIGGSSSDPWGSPDAIAFLNALDAGVLTSVSAGNNGPDAQTIAEPSNAPWVMSVAASTHNRVFLNALTNLTGGSTTPPANITGKGFTGPLATNTPIVYAGAAPYNNALCEKFAAGTDLSGKIVVCDRGTNGRVEKAQNVADAGGAGFVLANNESSGDSLITDLYPIPGVHITYDDGVALKTWLATGSTHTGRIAGATKNTDAANGDVLADFSSRGPDATSPDVIKPDLSAPGVDIIAAIADTDATTSEYGFESGTSMAAPHNAGAATLLRSLHPTWSPAEIKSALMSTAITAGVRKEDATTPADPFDIGGGRIDVARAALAGLVLDESAQGFADADPYYDGSPRDLNLASFADSACVVNCTWTRVVSNTLGTAATWNASTTATSMTLTVQPTSFTIQPGQTQTITLTANVSSSALGEYTFGSVTLTAQGTLANKVPNASFPVAVQPVAAKIPSVITGTANSKTGTVTVDNLTAVAISNLKINTYGLVSGHEDNLRAAQDSANGAYLDNLADGNAIQSFVVPTDTVRFVTEVVTTTAVDVDMYVFNDGSGAKAADGVPQADELVCTSATGSALERCDITAPDAGTYLVLVNNFEGSGLSKDLIKLSTAVVPPVSKGNLTVTGPTSVPAKQPFSLNLAYNISTLQPGSRWYGAITLATQPTGGIDLGYIPVDLVNTSHGQFLPQIGRK